MADNNDTVDLDLDELDRDINNTNKVEERIRNLTKREKAALKEKEEAEARAQALEAEKANLEKEKDFLSSFTDVQTKFPGAAEHKDAIWEKVQSGYTVEDAALVVAEANKSEEPEAEEKAPAKPESPAGGSATTVPTAIGEKSIDEMTRDEKLAALKEAEQKGELSTR